MSLSKYFCTSLSKHCCNTTKTIQDLVLLTQFVDFPADSSQLLLHLCGHDGGLASVNHIGHTVDLVLYLWIPLITVRICSERYRGVELNHNREERGVYGTGGKKKSVHNRSFGILLKVTESST